jgi:hypothetical protein
VAGIAFQLARDLIGWRAIALEVFMQQMILDYWQAFGVLIGIFGVWITWRQLKGGKPKTTNTIEHGDGNTQIGGQGTTENRVSRGSNNKQSG